MMRILAPTYKLLVTVKDPYHGGNQNSVSAGIDFTSAQTAVPSGHKYFDSLKGKTGCDEAVKAVKDALAKAGIEAEVWLEQFSHT